MTTPRSVWSVSHWSSHRSSGESTQQQQQLSVGASGVVLFDKGYASACGASVSLSVAHNRGCNICRQGLITRLVGIQRGGDKQQVVCEDSKIVGQHTTGIQSSAVLKNKNTYTVQKLGVRTTKGQGAGKAGAWHGR
jgi:hypothetical protein